MKDSQSLQKKSNNFQKENKKKRKFVRKNTAAPTKQPKIAAKDSSFSLSAWIKNRLATGKAAPKSKNQNTLKKIPRTPAQAQTAPLSQPDKTNGNRIFNNFLKRYDNDLALVLIPLILLVILAILNLINNQLQLVIQKNNLNSLHTTSKINPYPFINSVEIPTITAKAAIILDSDSQVILYSKNPDLRFSMASTTKIMTALTALDYFNKNSLLTVKSTGVEGSTLGLMTGDTLYFEDMLYAMLLPSANDAAETIADNYPGGVDSFVRKMNEKATAFYLTNSHFSDPTGLDDDGDYTTAVDMSHLASYAVKNIEFSKITSTKQKNITTATYHKQYSLNNLNKLLGIDGVTGIKTGTTQGAGEVLVTSTVENGHEFIIVVMNSTDRFSDTKTLLEFIKNNVKYTYPSIPLLK